MKMKAAEGTRLQRCACIRRINAYLIEQNIHFFIASDKSIVFIRHVKQIGSAWLMLRVPNAPNLSERSAVARNVKCFSRTQSMGMSGDRRLSQPLFIHLQIFQRGCDVM